MIERTIALMSSQPLALEQSDEYALKEALETRDLISQPLKEKLLQMKEEMEKFVIESPEKCTKTMQSMKQLLTDIEGEPYVN